MRYYLDLLWRKLLIAKTVVYTRIVLLVWGYLSYLRSLGRKPSYIRERHLGLVDLDSARKVAIFNHYDGGGRVPDFVLYYLREIAACGFAIIFVSNAPKLRPEAIEAIEPLCARIIRRDNIGRDFGAYKEGIAEIPDLAALDCLMIANDSVYGPLYKLRDVLARMPLDEADVWGATDNWQRRYHLQSYFLLFSPRALTNPAFHAFWDKLRFVQAKSWIIEKYEIGLSRSLIAGGLRLRALCPYREATKALVRAVRGGALETDGMNAVQRRFLEGMFTYVDNGTPLNSTHFFWDHLIASMRCPFLKRDLMRKNPAKIPFLHYWEDVIQQSTEYDTTLIEKHLVQSLSNRSI